MLPNFLDSPPRKTTPLGPDGDPSLRVALNAIFRRAVTHATLDGEPITLLRGMRPLPRGMRIFNNPGFLDWLIAQLERGLVNVYAFDDDNQPEVECDGTELQRPNRMERIEPGMTVGQFVGVIQRNLSRWATEIQVDDDRYVVESPAPGHRVIVREEAVADDDVPKFIDEESSSVSESSSASSASSSASVSESTSESESEPSASESDASASEPSASEGSVEPSEPGSESASESSSEDPLDCDCQCATQEEWDTNRCGHPEEVLVTGNATVESFDNDDCSGTPEFTCNESFSHTLVADPIPCRWSGPAGVPSDYCVFTDHVDIGPVGVCRVEFFTPRRNSDGAETGDIAIAGLGHPWDDLGPMCLPTDSGHSVRVTITNISVSGVA